MIQKLSERCKTDPGYLDTARRTMEEMRYPPYYVRENGTDHRLEEALQLLIAGHVDAEPGGTLFRVQSSTDVEKFYYVNGECSCPSAQYSARTGWCKHKVAVALWKRVEQALAPLGKPQGVPMAVAVQPPKPDAPVSQPMMIACLASHAPSTLPRPQAAILSDLSRPLPRECIAEMAVKGVKIAFVHWHTVAAVLDAYAAGWSGRVKKVEVLGGKVCVTYAITIPTCDGDMVREATGQEDETLDERSYGDSTSNAEAMAFKRAAAKFGVGAALYDKDAKTDAVYAAIEKGGRALVEKIDVLVAKHGWDRSLFWEFTTAQYRTTRISGLGHTGLLEIYHRLLAQP